MFVYLYISIDFCHKSKELRLKFTTNAYNVSKILTIIVILQNYFRKLSFFKKKNKFIVTHNFCCGSKKNPGRSCNMWRKGGRAGSSYELDAALSIQSKSFPHILDLPGGFIWKALEPSNVLFCFL